MTPGQHGSSAARMYLGMSGSGLVLLESAGEAETGCEPLLPGSAIYVPPGWAHRAVNVAAEPLVFLSAEPGGGDSEPGNGSGAGPVLLPPGAPARRRRQPRAAARPAALAARAAVPTRFHLGGDGK